MCNKQTRSSNKCDLFIQSHWICPKKYINLSIKYDIIIPYVELIFFFPNMFSLIMKSFSFYTLKLRFTNF